jgi:hypothetical protein
MEIEFPITALVNGEERIQGKAMGALIATGP